MKVLIAYATKEGQTEAVAERLHDRLVQHHGLVVDLFHVGSDDPEPPELSSYEGVILAASVHMGRHEREMVRFVTEHRGELDARKTAFVSVSMAEATAENRATDFEIREHAAKEVHDDIERFFAECEWRSDEVFPVAGALMYSKYNIIVRWVMKRIARKEGNSTDTGRDHIYTDWNELDHFADEYVITHKAPR